MLLPLVRTGSGKMAGFGQAENRAAREKIPRSEQDPSGRGDRQTFDFQQRRGDGTLSRS